MASHVSHLACPQSGHVSPHKVEFTSRPHFWLQHFHQVVRGGVPVKVCGMLSLLYFDLGSEVYSWAADRGGVDNLVLQQV